MKVFGMDQVKEPPRVDFQLVVKRDDVPETHEFTAIPKVSGQDMFMAIRVNNGSMEEIQGAVMMFRIISRSLVDDDGVSARWVPRELKRPQATWPEGEALHGDLAEFEDALAPVELEPAYRGPDGKIYPFSDAETLAAFTDPTKGSSRRRWLHLMETDTEADVQVNDVGAIMQWLMEQAADRPTVPSRS